MAGMRVVVVATAPNGNVDVADLRKKAGEHRDRLSALMITYPSTHGVFEDEIKDICAIVHEHGGQVYMDGANMNAQVGLDEPGLHRRGRLPSEPAQDVRHSARGRRPRHGSDRRRGAPGALPAGTSAREDRRRARDSRRIRGAVGEREHPADFLRLYPHARRVRGDRRHTLRHPECELHQGAARAALSRALRAGKRPRGARTDLRPARVQGSQASRKWMSRNG